MILWIYFLQINSSKAASFFSEGGGHFPVVKKTFLQNVTSIWRQTLKKIKPLWPYRRVENKLPYVTKCSFEKNQFKVFDWIHITVVIGGWSYNTLITNFSLLVVCEIRIQATVIIFGVWGQVKIMYQSHLDLRLFSFNS